MRTQHIGAVLLGALGFGELYAPGWNGFLFSASEVSTDTVRITSTVCFVGALVLGFMPGAKSN